MFSITKTLFSLILGHFLISGGVLEVNFSPKRPYSGRKTGLLYKSCRIRISDFKCLIVGFYLQIQLKFASKTPSKIKFYYIIAYQISSNPHRKPRNSPSWERLGSVHRISSSDRVFGDFKVKPWWPKAAGRSGRLFWPNWPLIGYWKHENLFQLKWKRFPELGIASHAVFGLGLVAELNDRYSDLVTPGSRLTNSG